MDVWYFAFILGALLYSFFYDPSFLKVYLFIVGAYCIGNIVRPSGKFNKTRTKIRLASWGEPTTPATILKMDVDLTYVDAFLAQHKDQLKERVTLGHITLKALTRMLQTGKELNGKVLFGKFIPFTTVKGTFHVDINNGEDLAIVSVDNCQDFFIEDIAHHVNEAARINKRNKGDEIHKRRKALIDKCPPFLLSLILPVVSFLTMNIGIDLSFLGVGKHQYGGGMFADCSSFGIHDMTAPLNNIYKLNSSVILCTPQERVVIKDGKPTICRMVKVNVNIDHRFIDGAKAHILVRAFYDVFKYPQKYFRLSAKHGLAPSEIPIEDEAAHERTKDI